MPQVFKPGANTLATLSLFAGAALPFALLQGGSILTNSPYNTKVDVPLDQPAPFSHKHHTIELGIDCQFCHTTVTKSAVAGVPSTDVCMSCHSQIWTNSPNLEAVRKSWETNTALQWNKVNFVPDFVYFNHSIHIDRGISCNNCHGAINEMQITSRGQAFRMGWCLECHKEPEKYLYADPKHPDLTPKEQVFNLYRKLQAQEELTPSEERLAKGLPQLAPNDAVHDNLKLMKDRGINATQLRDCYVCHH